MKSKYISIIKSRCGYTLIEMMIVIMIMGILASIAVPIYKRYQIKARESVLIEDLYQMRRAIDAYYADYTRYPDTLGSLVEGRYIRSIPRDPITRDVKTWKCIEPEYNQQGNLPEGGCFDVASGSKLIGLNGVPYAQW